MKRVVAVMLVDGRPELVQRAIRCFRAQTYENKRLLIYDSGDVQAVYPEYWPIVDYVRASCRNGQTIGELRNAANRIAEKDGAEIIIHWDSDDWSAPTRIQEQVTVLRIQEQIVGLPGMLPIPCIGMNRMRFWREQEREAWFYSNPNPNYALGTSLCYWTRFWAENLFTANHGEESEFSHWLRLNVVNGNAGALDNLMVASIHSGNQHRNPYRRELMVASEMQGGEWKRALHLDESTAAVMAL